MNIPDNLNFQAVCFMDMADGGYEQHYVNKEHGISVVKFRANRKEKPGVLISIKAIPDKVFSSFEEFRKAVKELP